MADYNYAGAVDLTQIAQDKVANLTRLRPIFTHFPITTTRAPVLMWEQVDNYIGLQGIRGINGEPGKVVKTGAKRYTAQPGYYGEFEPLDEMELTTRRQWGTFGTPIDINDLVMQAQDKLLLRQNDRIESVLWNLCTTGTFSVAGPSGAILATDSYSTQTATAAVTWATSGTATPLADLRSVQLLAAGHSLAFNGTSVAYMNRITYNALLSNTNANDLGGRRLAGLTALLTPAGLTEVLMADDLPGIMVYDEGYLAEPSGTFTRFIPNNKVIVIGKRSTGEPIGEYRMTENVNSPAGMGGTYMKVKDDNDVPRHIDVHAGHNGGPIMTFPSAIVVLTI